MRAITVICISVLILSAIGCRPPQKPAHPAMYSAAGVTDTGGNPHFIFTNDFRDVVTHFWKEGNTWHKEDVRSLPGYLVGTVTYGNDGICAYTYHVSGWYKGCTADNSNWNVHERQYTIPPEYSGWECGWFAWTDDGRLDDGRYILGCMNPDESAPKIYEFFIVDDINGVVNEYLSPLDLTRILSHDAPPPFELTREPWLLQAAFLDDGAWDAKSYIVGVVFESAATEGVIVYFYHVSFKEADWAIEKVGEMNLIGDVLGVRTFKGKRVTMVKEQAVVKRDGNSGRIVLEPLETKYVATYDAAYHVADEKGHGMIVADVVTSDGKLHALMRDITEDETVLYYYMYNPDSPTPEVPETVERLDAEEYR